MLIARVSLFAGFLLNALAYVVSITALTRHYQTCRSGSQCV